MDFMTPRDAELLAQLVTTIAIPFIVSYFKKVQWKPIYKFGLAVLLAAIAGGLTAYASGNFRGTLVENFVEIFTASQGIYYVFFKHLGLEQALDPKTALADQLKEEVVDAAVAPMSDTQARDILDEETPSQVVVSTNITGTQGM